MSTTTLSSPFTPADYAVLEAAYPALRSRAVELALSGDYAGHAEVVEVCWPARPCADQRTPGANTVPWVLYRDGDGVRVEALDLSGEVLWAQSIQDAVDVITEAVDAEIQAAVDAIPATLQRR